MHPLTYTPGWYIIYSLYTLPGYFGNAIIIPTLTGYTNAYRFKEVSMKEDSENFAKNDSVKQDSSASCPHCGRTTDRPEAEKKKLQNRLKRIEGQVRGIQAMLENNAYCNDILIQSAAVNAAMNAFNRDLLASHIHHCVTRDIREGKDEVVDELVNTLQKLMK